MNSFEERFQLSRNCDKISEGIMKKKVLRNQERITSDEDYNLPHDEDERRASRLSL